MTFTDPGDFSALQIVDETDMDNIRNSLLWLQARTVPVGVIDDFGGDVAPTGYLLCDGSAVSRVDYAALFDVIGSKFGPGNGSTTFNLPDFRRKIAIGKADAGAGANVGDTGGSANAVVVSHNHTQNSHGHSQNAHSHGNDAHSHGADDNDAGGHTHDSTSGVSNVVQAGAGPFNVNGSGSNWVTFDAGHVFRTSNDGTHNHNITVNAAGITIHNATATNNGTTATNNATGVSATDANLPPYVVVHKIIKY